MFRSWITLAVLLGSFHGRVALGQPMDKIRLVVMADDFAANHAVNEGTLNAFKKGVVTTTNVIVPAAWFPEAVAMAKDNPGLDVGIHLALTSEWELYKWRPLTRPKTLVDRDGFFFSMVWKNSKLPDGNSLQESGLDLTEVEVELRAQIELARRKIPRVSYLWPHMVFSGLRPELRSLVDRLGKEYNIPNFQTVIDTMGLKSLAPGYSGEDSAEVKADKLIAALESIGPGTWLMVDHASLDSDEMRAMSHAGYDWVARDRSGNMKMWMDPGVQAILKKRGIELVSAGKICVEYLQRN
ncbi:MAG: ChbG/HpnK family deacetylase [Deltaproteobacteria bacterium]|nr:ChbG/HpnK family deacetylase [Deltaproteobacteria bacterium]